MGISTKTYSYMITELLDRKNILDSNRKTNNITVTKTSLNAEVSLLEKKDQH